jgi:hypothetical protein
MHKPASLACLLVVTGAVTAQGYTTDFETFTATPLGTPMAGQDGFYIPAVAGSIDGAMYTYAGNPHGVPVNIYGGNNFWAGASQGGTAFAARPARADVADGQDPHRVRRLLHLHGHRLADEQHRQLLVPAVDELDLREPSRGVAGHRDVAADDRGTPTSSRAAPRRGR